MSLLLLVAAGLTPAGDPARLALLGCGFFSIAVVLRRTVGRVPVPVKVQAPLRELPPSSEVALIKK